MPVLKQLTVTVDMAYLGQWQKASGMCLVQVGQAVTFVGGAFSEYSTVPAAGCWPVREASPEAACLAISGLTAIGALEV